MVTEILAQIADPGREPSRVVLDTQLILRGSALPASLALASNPSARGDADGTLEGRRPRGDQR
jgi:hypothetical protein